MAAKKTVKKLKKAKKLQKTKTLRMLAHDDESPKET
jgi:hypothetical protein